MTVALFASIDDIDNQRRVTTLPVDGDFTLDVSGTVRIIAGKNAFIQTPKGALALNTPEDEQGNPIVHKRGWIAYKDRMSTIMLRRRLERRTACGCHGR